MTFSIQPLVQHFMLLDNAVKKGGTFASNPVGLDMILLFGAGIITRLANPDGAKKFLQCDGHIHTPIHSLMN